MYIRVRESQTGGGYQFIIDHQLIIGLSPLLCQGSVEFALAGYQHQGLVTDGVYAKLTDSVVNFTFGILVHRLVLTAS
jgi:hypothetical protein